MFKKESYFMTFDFNFNTNSICNLLWINFAITRRSCDSMQKMYIIADFKKGRLYW